MNGSVPSRCSWRLMHRSAGQSPWVKSCTTTLPVKSSLSVPTLCSADTDRFVQKTLGKTSLDVGADRIARTAHAALKVLGELRRNLNVSIPLAWDPQELADVSVIEVYPAATLIAHEILATGYKKPHNIEERKEITEALRAHLTLPTDDSELTANADALDAAVCVLAAKDFLESKADPPEDKALAEREGWIWCARRTR